MKRQVKEALEWLSFGSFIAGVAVLSAFTYASVKESHDKCQRWQPVFIKVDNEIVAFAAMTKAEIFNYIDAVEEITKEE